VKPIFVSPENAAAISPARINPMAASTGAPTSHSAHATITRRVDQVARDPGNLWVLTDVSFNSSVPFSRVVMMLNRLPRYAAVVTLALAPSIVRAQDSTSMHISIHVPDSVAHVVDREQPKAARFAIVSRDGQAQLLLMDTTIVAQMTDRGLAHMSSRHATDSIKGTAERIFARMALGALTPLFDHGIAYHLRDLADARYENGRLLIVGANGDEVFRDVEVGKGPLMEGFTREDAVAFAAHARAARTRLGR